MPHVYRLSPIPHTLHDRRWQQSNTKEEVWVWAETPEDAREVTAGVTLKAAPMIPGAVLMPSPWLDDALTICTLEPSKTDVPKGKVVKSNGEPV